MTINEIAADLANIHFASEFGHLPADWQSNAIRAALADNGIPATSYNMGELADAADAAWRNLAGRP